MTPDLTARLHRALADAASSLRYVDDAAHPNPPLVGYGVRDQVAQECARLAALLTTDPGGAMPEPDAGMRVTLASGHRGSIDFAEACGSMADTYWQVYVSGPGRSVGREWTPTNIREIRDTTGRVIWRAA